MDQEILHFYNVQVLDLKCKEKVIGVGLIAILDISIWVIRQISHNIGDSRPTTTWVLSSKKLIPFGVSVFCTIARIHWYLMWAMYNVFNNYDDNQDSFLENNVSVIL